MVLRRHSEQIEAAKRAFIYQLGDTLASWQSVEEQTYYCFATIMRGSPDHLVSVTWHHVQSFDSRLELLNRCLHFVFDRADNPAWKTLFKRLEKASKVRNLIVHSTYGVQVTDKGAKAFGRPFIHDSTAIIRKRANNPEYQFDASRLQAEGRAFEVLAVDLEMFRESTLEHRQKG